jgi:hypothetical protein
MRSSLDPATTIDALEVMMLCPTDGEIQGISALMLKCSWGSGGTEMLVPMVGPEEPD